jgi:hypothetical protein
MRIVLQNFCRYLLKTVKLERNRKGTNTHEESTGERRQISRVKENIETVVLVGGSVNL